MKGQLAVDLIVMAIVIFGISVVYIYKSGLNNSIVTPLIAQNATGNQGTQMLTSQRDNFAPLWDNLVIFIFALLWVFLLVSSYYINTSPIFFIIMVILMVGAFIVIMFLGNVFDTLNQGGTFASNATSFPKTVWLNYHILEVMVVVGVTSGIALYAKREGTGGYV